MPVSSPGSARIRGSKDIIQAGHILHRTKGREQKRGIRRLHLFETMRRYQSEKGRKNFSGGKWDEMRDKQWVQEVEKPCRQFTSSNAIHG